MQCSTLEDAAPILAVVCTCVLLWQLTPANVQLARFAPVAVYLLHPLTLLLGGLKGDGRVVENALLLAALVLLEGKGAVVRSASALALAAAFATTPVQALCVSLASLSCFLGDGKREGEGAASSTSSGKWTTVALPAVVAAASAGFLWACAPFTLSDGLRPQTVDPSSSIPELSATWYLWSLVFTRSLPYFTIAIWAHPLLYPVPLAIRFR
jgi:hypothetical protein